jgi:hypothetical protein
MPNFRRDELEAHGIVETHVANGVKDELWTKFVAGGGRPNACGWLDDLAPAGLGALQSSARSLRLQPAGKVLITDGPYAETKEHIGGFWVLKATDLDEALARGRKAAVACGASVEVRPFH